MIDLRVTSKIPIGNNQYKARVRITSRECPANTLESRNIQLELLKDISLDPALTQCGSGHAETMKLYHTGKYWEILCERTETENTQNQDGGAITQYTAPT